MDGQRCKSILKNNYKIILEQKFEAVVDNASVSLNEVKYKCVYSSMYIKKGMYDRFGKWNKVIFPADKNHPVLLWENVKLFEGNPSEFNVAASGLENKETIYASVLVFNKNNEDLLSTDSAYKPKLIGYFSEMIKTNNSSKREFYETYWRDFDPIRWEKMMQNHKSK